MKLSSASHSLIEQTLKSVWKCYPAGKEPQAVTDVHIQPKNDSGELLVFNDDEEILARAVIEEWEEIEYSDEMFYAQTETMLRDILKKWHGQGLMDNLSIMKPYSFVLVDAEKETVAELLLVDDDTLMLSDELLKGLDKELDEFLKKLLEE